MATAHTAAAGSYQPLDYEQQIVEELTSEDGLCITAAGLGWHRVVAAMLAMHDDPQHSIVLILGATAWQRRLICQELHRIDAGLSPPADITADVPAWQRLQLYQQSAHPQQQQQQQQQGQQQPQQQAVQQQDGQPHSTAADTEAAADHPGSDGNIGQAAAGVGTTADTGQPSTATVRPPPAVAAADRHGSETGHTTDAAALDSGSGPKDDASRSGKTRQCSACFVTTRILVVDILSSRIRPQQIAGLIIINAHYVSETSGEGFAVRLFRQGPTPGFDPNAPTGNTTGFLRAFSDNPNAFAAGFNRIEKVMKALRVRRLLLFPRFHQTVKDSLEAQPPELEEWEADPSPGQLQLVEAVREVLSALLKDLTCNNRLDASDLRPTEDLSRPLDRAVRQQLEPLWHTLTWRSRTAVKDLATVQGLVSQLLRYDAVTFLTLLEGVRLSEAGSSIWLLHEATHIMYEQARRRVYKAILPAYRDPNAAQQQQQSKSVPKGAGRKRGRAAASNAANAAAAAVGEPTERASKVARTGNDSTAADASSEKVRIDPVLEAPPKWDLLLQLVQEVEQQRQQLRVQADAAVVVEEGDSELQVEEPKAPAGRVRGLQQQQQRPQQQQQQQQQQANADVVELLSCSEDEADNSKQQQQEEEEEQPLRLTAAAIAAMRALAHAPLLIVCKELHSQQQLQQVVQKGPEAVMQQLYRQYLQNQLAATIGSRAFGARGRARGRGRGRCRGRTGEQQAGPGGAAAAGSGGAGGGRGMAGRGRGARGTAGNSRRDAASVLWAGRGPAVNPAERQALVEAAQQLEQEEQQQQPGTEATTAGAPSEPLAAHAPSATAAAADAAAVGGHLPRGAGQGVQGRGAAAAGARGKGRGRGRGRQQQRQRLQQASSDSDSEWSISSDSEGGTVPGHHSHRTGAAQRGQAPARTLPTAAAPAPGGAARQAAGGAQRTQQPLLQQPQQQQHAEQDQDVLQGVHFYALDLQDPFVLWRLQPGFVLLYDSDLTFLRQLEVYQAERARILAATVQQQQLPAGLSAVRIFTASYSGPLEKSAFQSAVARESNVFADLIRAKQHLVLPLDMGQSTLQQLLPPLQEQAQALQLQYRNTGRVPQLPAAAPSDGLWLDVYSANALSRVGGLGRRNRPVPHKLVVDVREFMSGLPAVLHTQGFELTPITLEVGDYVLSPDIVVERKALPDLFASLGSGRLYNQAEAMTKGYKTAILLIEFDGDKTFALTGQSEVATELDHRSPQARLVLLLLHFPKLRLLWSRSQHATGELFLALKRNQEEPDAAAAALVGLTPEAAAAAAAAAAAPVTEAAGAAGDAAVPATLTSATAMTSAAAQVAAAQREESVVNQAAIDVLRRLPGVTDANYRALMNAASSLAELATFSCERLEQLMGGSKAAQALHNFLHAPCPLTGLGPATLATA